MTKRKIYICCAVVLGLSIMAGLPFIVMSAKLPHYKFKVEEKEQITKKEMEEDLQWMKYFLENAWINYDESVENGLDLDAVFDKIRSYAKPNFSHEGYITTFEFGRSIYSAFESEKTLNDYAFYLYYDGYWHNPKNTYAIFYSDVYFEKIGDEYFVCESKVPEIKKGEKYLGIEKNLYKWSVNEDIYRFAILANSNMTVASIKTSDGVKHVPVSEHFVGDNNEHCNILSTEDSIYFSLSQGRNDNGNYIEKNARFREKLDAMLPEIRSIVDKKKNVIVDLRSSVINYDFYLTDAGTSVLFPWNETYRNECRQFWNSLAYDQSILISPVTFREFTMNSVRDRSDFFLKTYKKETRDAVIHGNKTLVHSSPSGWTELPHFDRTPNFKGTIYVLMNKDTSAETAILSLLTATDKVVLIGENTRGRLKYYSGGMSYYLQNSGIVMNFSYLRNNNPAVDFNPKYKEGYGIIPDYWRTNDKILETLIDLTGDNNLNDLLDGLEKGAL